MLTFRKTIRPSAGLRNHYNEVSGQCRENKEAVVITVNGRGDTVSLAYEEYYRLKARIELLEILAEAEEDVSEACEICFSILPDILCISTPDEQVIMRLPGLPEDRTRIHKVPVTAY